MTDAAMGGAAQSGSAGKECGMKFTIYAANVTGVQDNCLYPNRFEVDGPEIMRQVIRRDHVLAAYKNNYRGKLNFISSDCLVMDVDNDHSENPDEWIKPEDLAAEYEGIKFAIAFSRNHMRQKGQYGPRPRYHICFWIEPVTDYEQYGDMKAALYAMYPFYDDNCLDAGRFIYGSESEEIIWHDGEKTILSIIGSVGGGDLYVSYGGTYKDPFGESVDNPTAYEGLWWAPDSRRYVIAFRWLNEDQAYLELGDLVRSTGTNVIAGANLYWRLTEQRLAPVREEPPKIDYQFLHWGKDSASMLLYYNYEDEGSHEGYFWNNCETGNVTGILEMK